MALNVGFGYSLMNDRNNSINDDVADVPISHTTTKTLNVN